MRKKSALTFLEALLVFALIVLGAILAVPFFSRAAVVSTQSKAMQQAKGIFIGLRLFAEDYGDSYPTQCPISSAPHSSVAAPVDANQAYANLVPDYVPSENPFSIPTSRYCKDSAGVVVVPKNDFSQPGHANVLPAGTNAFADVMGLNVKSDGRYPVITDGFAGPAGLVQDPAFSKDESDTPGNLFIPVPDPKHPWLIGCRVLNPAQR